MNIALILVLGALLAGCAATTPRIEPARLAEVEKGKTTAAEVLRRFGTPSVLSRNPDGTQTATYVYAEQGSGGSGVVPLLAIVPRDAVSFHFDARGLLADVRTTQAGAGATQAQAGNHAPGSAGDATKAGATMRPASPGAETNRTWQLPGWLPPSTTENR